MPLTPEQIAAATGCPLGNVAEHWPNILAALDEQGINTDAVQIAAAGTVAVETGSFQPIHELHANPGRQPGLFAQQSRYWSTGFYGRGFIQLSLLPNYQEAGDALGIDLVGNPELAMDPVNAARIFAWFFRKHGIQGPAEAHDWTRLRRIVNGGTNGLPQFLAICGRLS